MRTYVRCIADHRSPHTVVDAAVKTGNMLQIEASAAALPNGLVLYRRARILLVGDDTRIDRRTRTVADASAGSAGRRPPRGPKVVC